MRNPISRRIRAVRALATWPVRILLGVILSVHISPGELAGRIILPGGRSRIAVGRIIAVSRICGLTVRIVVVAKKAGCIS